MPPLPPNFTSDPILSLIDTSVVGRSNPLSLAAMGPATMLIDSSIFLCWFLGISTTNLLASTNPPPDGKSPTTPTQRKIIQTALSTSLLAGLFITFVVSLNAVGLLTWISGAKNKALIPEALTYVRIRALSAPLAVVGMVCQVRGGGGEGERTTTMVLTKKTAHPLLPSSHRCFLSPSAGCLLGQR